MGSIWWCPPALSSCLSGSCASLFIHFCSVDRRGSLLRLALQFYWQMFVLVISYSSRRHSTRVSHLHPTGWHDLPEVGGACWAQWPYYPIWGEPGEQIVCSVVSLAYILRYDLLFVNNMFYHFFFFCNSYFFYSNNIKKKNEKNCIIIIIIT